MSTPTAGPDDRSPQTEAEHEKRMFDLLIDLVSEARDVERFSTWAKNERSERESLDEVSRLRGEILSALRSARRDTERLEQIEAWLRANPLSEVGFVRSMGEGFFYVGDLGEGDSLREAIDDASLASPPILEKNDRG